MKTCFILIKEIQHNEGELILASTDEETIIKEKSDLELKDKNYAIRHRSSSHCNYYIKEVPLI